MTPIRTERGKIFDLDNCYAIKEEKVHFDLTGINENVKIAITPLTKKQRQIPLCHHEYLINAKSVPDF